jgi:23S rRNA (cytidine1920-2'-O)/16S rRNA (cytidine1409-2'-O)-methyltransferase
MVARGLADSRDWAQRLVRAGEVRVNGQVIDQPAKLLVDDPAMTIAVDAPPKYVSRGGFKLEGALDAFAIDPSGLICADVGSSTGGFTDCLLQRGAPRVYALDVGNNQLHWKLRNDARIVAQLPVQLVVADIERVDARIVIQEKVNVRHVDALAEPIQFAVIDVSFISLALILPKVFGWFTPGAQHSGVVALIKPQFEAGREKVGKGGIVRDPAVHDEVVARVTATAFGLGWARAGLIDSPILGTDGNKEFLAWFRPQT